MFPKRIYSPRKVLGVNKTEMNGDKELSDLLAKKSEIEAIILLKQRNLRREQGLVVDSISDLKCEKHPNSSYEVLEKIGESKDIAIYVCKDCKADNSLEGHYNKSRAHDCPICQGIVKGDIVTIPYTSPREDWQALAGREGNHYHCSQCNSHIASHYWGYS